MITLSDLSEHKRQYPDFYLDRMINWLDLTERWAEFKDVAAASRARKVYDKFHGVKPCSIEKKQE